MFMVDTGMTTLLDFKYKKKFVAEDGVNGGTSKCYGKDGEDLVINVPLGTIIREASTNKIIADLSHKDEEFKFLIGGKGGKGNAKFCHSNKASTSFC